jgi:hypothetical protein
MKPALAKIQEENFQAIALHYSGAGNTALSEAQKAILDRWRTAHALLHKYPRKQVCINMLRARYEGLSAEQARLDVEAAARLWNMYNKIDREFLEQWFIDRLLKELSDKTCPPAAIAQNLKTLKDYIVSAPPTTVDPRLVEQNNVSITFNIAGNNISFKEAELEKMSEKTRQKLLGAIPHEIGEEQAAEILNS